MPQSPIVIAHRGASGYLPEHTLAAKALAYGQGADYLEQDVVATRDGRLVVLHDLFLDDVTDVAQRFPARRRDDGHYYVVDFDLEELESLRVFERRAPGSAKAKWPRRFPVEHGLFGIATLSDELRLIQGLNRSTGRAVGVYAEIKEPAWHRAHGIDLTALLLAELAEFGYSRATDLAFVQCFDAAELERAKGELGCELRLVQLVGHEPKYAALLTRDGLRRVADYAYGLGPHHSQVVAARAGGPARPLELVEHAATAGLRMHPYTFRRDELPAYADSLEEWLEIFIVEAKVDGVFCDHPDVAVRVRDAALKVQ
jgi:glycerophosphoryl diester phosphodiesterase